MSSKSFKRLNLRNVTEGLFFQFVLKNSLCKVLFSCTQQSCYFILCHQVPSQEDFYLRNIDLAQKQNVLWLYDLYAVDLTSSSHDNRKNIQNFNHHKYFCLFICILLQNSIFLASCITTSWETGYTATVIIFSVNVLLLSLLWEIFPPLC